MAQDHELRAETERVTAWLVRWLAKEARRTPAEGGDPSAPDSGERFLVDAQRELTPAQIQLLLTTDTLSKTFGDLTGLVAQQLGHEPSEEELVRFTEDRKDLFGQPWSRADARRALDHPEQSLIRVAVEKVLESLPRDPGSFTGG